MSRKRIAISGGLECLHSGHLNMMEEASRYGDLIVILNSDDWLRRKKGREPFMPFQVRAHLIRSLKFVSEVYMALDDDNTVCASLELLKPDYFANGGDRVEGNTPEKETCERLGIQMLFGVGGDNGMHSSQFIEAIKGEGK